MKILVIGGTHGNEPLGQQVVEQLDELPQTSKDIDTLLANQLAIDTNVRYVKRDLNRSFPGDILSKDYEERRAAEIIQKCQEYDLVLDFHNTTCPDNDCVFVGTDADGMLYDVAAYFCLNRVIVADYDCLNKFAPNCVSIEVSLNSLRMNADEWVQQIIKLSTRKTKPQRAVSQEIFRFVYRMTLEDRDELRLDVRQLKAFQPIPKKLADSMGVKSPAYPIFVADSYTEYNFGGLLNKINV